MKIRVKDIKPEGLKVNDEISIDVIGDREDDGLHFIEPLRVEAFAVKGKGNVDVTSKISSKYASFCCRCLDPVEKEFLVECNYNYEISTSTDFIDLTEDLRQEIIMDFPDRILCKEECIGLCPDCGINLNNEKCKCKILSEEEKTEEFKTYKPFENLKDI